MVDFTPSRPHTPPSRRRGRRACPAPVGSASWEGRTNSSSG
jgi:hypothetical protein